MYVRVSTHPSEAGRGGGDEGASASGVCGLPTSLTDVCPFPDARDPPMVLPSHAIREIGPRTTPQNPLSPFVRSTKRRCFRYRRLAPPRAAFRRTAAVVPGHLNSRQTRPRPPTHFHAVTINTRGVIGSIYYRYQPL